MRKEGCFATVCQNLLNTHITRGLEELCWVCSKAFFASVWMIKGCPLWACSYWPPAGYPRADTDSLSYPNAGPGVAWDTPGSLGKIPSTISSKPNMTSVSNGDFHTVLRCLWRGRLVHGEIRATQGMHFPSLPATLFSSAFTCSSAEISLKDRILLLFKRLGTSRNYLL